MKKYKYLLWDLDGTLTDSLPGVAKGLDILFNHYNMTIPKEEYRSYVGPPLRTSFAQHFEKGAKMEEALQIFRDYYNVTGIYEATLFDNIETVLKTLKNRGYIMYIATSKRESVAIEVVKNFGIIDYFKQVFGADDTIGIIEKEDVLNNIFAQNPNIKKSDCVMIGDTIYDGRGAQILGIDFFAALYGFGNRDDVLNMQPVGSVENVIDYLDIFK